MDVNSLVSTVFSGLSVLVVEEVVGGGDAVVVVEWGMRRAPRFSGPDAVAPWESSAPQWTSGAAWPYRS
jgi:hypothetical protein